MVSKPLTGKRMTKERAESIAREYCSNGYNKEQALIDNEYSESYARGGESAKVYSNLLVIEAIDKIRAELSAKTAWDVKESERRYKEAYDLALACKQPSAMVSAVQAVNKMYSLDIDKGYRDTDKPESLSEADLATLRDLSRVVTDKALKGPVLAQDGQTPEDGGNHAKRA